MLQKRKLLGGVAVAALLAMTMGPTNLAATLGINTKSTTSKTTTSKTTTSKTKKATTTKKKAAVTGKAGGSAAPSNSAVATKALPLVRTFRSQPGVTYEFSGEARSASDNSQITMSVTAGAPGADHRRAIAKRGKWDRVSFALAANSANVEIAISSSSTSIEFRNLALVRAATLPTDVAEVSNGNTWTQTWADEFDGQSIDTSTWTPHEPWYPAGRSNEVGADTYSPPDPIGTGIIGINVSDDGTSSLRITARREANPLNKALVSAELIARPRSSSQVAGQFTNGYIEARIKAPESPWLWPAFWLLGNGTGPDGWPKTGEIDIFEFVNSPPDVNPEFPRQRPFFTAIWGCQSTMNYCKRTRNDPYPDFIDQGAWHTYGLLRLEDRIVSYIDGKETFTLRRSDEKGRSETGGELAELAPLNPIFTAPMHVRISLGAGNWDTSVGDAAQPGELLVDYVRAYEIRSCPSAETSNCSGDVRQ
jgi:beta-glucanase (GH16 family)